MIFRKDWDNPFVREVSWNEIVQTKKDGTVNKNWNDKPEFMTKKTLIAQGMRLCFPEDMGGMPYVDAELYEMDPVPVTPVIDASESVALPQVTLPKSSDPTIVQSETTHQTLNQGLRVLSIKGNYVKKSYQTHQTQNKTKELAIA